MDIGRRRLGGTGFKNSIKRSVFSMVAGKKGMAVKKQLGANAKGISAWELRKAGGPSQFSV